MKRGGVLEEDKRTEVHKVLVDTRKLLQSSNPKEIADSVEALSGASKVLSEVILYKPTAAAQEAPNPEGGGSE